MKGLMVLSFAVFLWANAALSELVTVDSEIEMEMNEKLTVECQASMVAGSTLMMYVKNDVAMIVSTTSLDSPIKIQTTTSKDIDVSYSEISPSNPPMRTATITLTVNETSRSDEGEYKCQLGEQKSFTKVLVVGPPHSLSLSTESDGVELIKKPVFDRNQYPDSQELWHCLVDIDIEESIELSAEADARPVASIKWSAIDKNYEVSQDTVNIERNELSMDGATYSCTATNNHGSYVITIIVIPQYKPKVTRIVNPDMYPEEGKSLIAACEFDAKPEAVVSYVKENPEDGSWTRIPSRDDGKLFIAEVRLDKDVGRYLCIGDNGLGNTTGVIMVHGKPKDVIISVDTVYGKSAALIVSCFSAVPVQFTLISNSTDKEGTLRTENHPIDKRDEQQPPRIRIPFNLEHLEPMTHYNLTLRAYNRHGESYSETITITTRSADVVPTQKPVIKKKEPMDNDNDNAACSYIASCVLVSLCVLLNQF